MIRTYRSEDLGQIAAWWDSGIDDIQRPDATWSDHVLNDERAHCICYAEDDTVLGYGQCDVEDDRGFILVVVHPEHLRRGIATQLVATLREHASARGIATLSAYIEPGNQASLALATAAGMCHAGASDGYLLYETAI